MINQIRWKKCHFISSPSALALLKLRDSTDIKLRDMQKDYSKVTEYLIQLIARLSDVLRSKPNVNDIESKTEIVQVILDGLKLAGYGNRTHN